MDIHPPVENEPLISSSSLVEDASLTVEDNNTPSSDDNNNNPSSITDVNNDDYFPNPSLHNPTALETIKWWAEYTSIHGMYYIFERGHFQRWKKFTWSIVVSVCFITLLIAIISEFKSYNDYNIDTTTKTVIPTSLHFPNVILCNANGGVDGSLQNSTGIIEPRNEEELMSISQSLTDFIVRTQFNNKVYNTSSSDELNEVWSTIITQYGLCYEFKTDESVFIPGINAGLIVYTWLNQSSYPIGVDWAGVHVLIGGNNNNSNNDNESKDNNNDNNSNNNNVVSQSGTVLVPPGAVSFISLLMQDIQREENKPLNCLPGGTTIDECRLNCIMDATRAKCGCRIIGDTTANSEGLDYCNSTDDVCRESINDDDVSICQTCAYPPLPPCKEQTYTTSYSAGRISQNLIQETANQQQETNFNELSNNLAVIHINYASIQYTSTTETKSTSTWQLFSNLGGSFGFFMGISIISIVEFFVELIGLRLIPRLWGREELYGIGKKKFN